MTTDICQKIYREVQTITPYDTIEQAHIADVLSWIESGAPLFRIKKPDKPAKHLVSYFVLVDLSRKSLLLVDHMKAQLWLPAGGHVEVDEAPVETVQREMVEELGRNAPFLYGKSEPIFITVTKTVGLTAGHTDVSLWYVLAGDINEVLVYDRNEFNAIRWFTFDDVLKMPIQSLDPHLHRFVRKFLASLSS